MIFSSSCMDYEALSMSLWIPGRKISRVLLTLETGSWTVMVFTISSMYCRDQHCTLRMLTYFLIICSGKGSIASVRSGHSWAPAPTFTPSSATGTHRTEVT